MMAEIRVESQSHGRLRMSMAIMFMVGGFTFINGLCDGDDA
jgi:hypothetical protein